MDREVMQMKKRIIGYRERIDHLLQTDSKETDWCQVLEDHFAQIAFFQHERLIHLILTVTFAVLAILSFGIMLLSGFLPVLGLTGLLLVLLIPYIGHYYTLENEVQKMYQQYDEILIHIRAKKEHTK